jgi:outer membrane lipoprotein-sorting protein
MLTRSLFCLLAFEVTAADDNVLLDKWLAKQVNIKTWTADVVQTRKIKLLVRPLQSRGQVWFVQPNQFRWQLGDPPRTIAVRTQQELVIAYPKLNQLERYRFDNITDPAMQQALALLEVGFPSEPKRFHDRYELLSVIVSKEIYQFELQAKDVQARRLLTKVRLDVSAKDLTLLATELEFPDGSSMRNTFSQHKLNIEIDMSLFQINPNNYTVVEPLQREK